MKKIFLSFTFFVLAIFAHSQVMDEMGFKNTVWTGLGSSLSKRFSYYGLMDTFQTRQDVGKFTIEGMLNMGFLANYDANGRIANFTFSVSDKNPLQFHYGHSSSTQNAYNNAMKVTNVLMDSYYVNFFWHFAKFFDLGMGTKLNWQVGPAPKYGGWLWESTAHVRQGGFSTSYDDRSGSVWNRKFNVDAPGSADVVGFVPYANKYAKKSIGFRFKNDSVLGGIEAGVAIPDGFNTDDIALNFGFRLGITKWLSISAVMEGVFDDKENLYAGAQVGFEKLLVEAYFAADSLFSTPDDDIAFGTGLAITFRIGKTNQFSFRPEVGFNFFQHPNYTTAWFTGLTFDWAILKSFGFGAYASLAFGSRDRTWKDNSATEKWNGGWIVNARPNIYFMFGEKMKLSAYFSFENRRAFDATNRFCWSTGAYFEVKFANNKK